MSTPTPQSDPGKAIPPGVLIAGALVVVAVIVGGVLTIRRGGDRTDRSTATSGFGVLADRGDVAECALSADGKYLVYTLRGQGALWVRLVGTAGDTQILPPQRDVPHDLRFTPDGSHAYYLAYDPARTGYRALYSIPRLGGAPVKRADDVDSRITFSPDSDRIAFIRRLTQQSRDDLVILDLRRNEERVLASVSAPLSFLPAAPDWSPDGKRVAVVEARGGVVYGSAVVTFRVEDGRREAVGAGGWRDVANLSWLPDGSGFVVTAFEPSTRTGHQLWTLTYPGGRLQRIASEPGFYSDLSLSADGTTLAALRYQQGMNLWCVAADGERDVRQVTFMGEESEISSMDPGESGQVYFEMFQKGSARIWTIGEDGAGQKPVTTGPNRTFSPSYRPGAGLFYVREEPDLATHIWHADANGERARAVTSGTGERVVDISPDGRTVLFQRDDTSNVLWSVSSEGGKPTRLGPSAGLFGFFSPDGSRIFHILINHVGGEMVVTPEIIMARDGERAITAAISPTYLEPAWTPDGTGLTYIHDSNERRNLFRVRVAGGPSDRITRFNDGRIEQYQWSPDGKRILFHRSVGDVQNLWVTDALGEDAVAITDFTGGNIGGMRWTRDSRRVILMHGEPSQNVVLLRNFK